MLLTALTWNPAWERLTSWRGVFPDVEFDIGGGGFTTRPIHPEFTTPRRILILKSVRMTNHERDRRVSLTLRYRKPVVAPDGVTDNWSLLPLTKMPFDVEAKTSRNTDIEFEDTLQHPDFKDAGLPPLVDVEDHLSGKRTPLPQIGNWRPAKQGEWKGGFPAPKPEPSTKLRPEDMRETETSKADLGVVIEKVEWDAFQHEAFILELKVRIRNQTKRTKHATGYRLQVGGRPSSPIPPGIEAHREVERRLRSHQRLDNQSTIEAGESIVGWLVYALPWSFDPGPSEYELRVMDELNIEYPAEVSAP